MKRYMSIFLIACLLTGCVSAKPHHILNEIASRDTGGAPKTGEANEGGYNEKAIRRYAEDNLSIYTTDEGEKCLWIDDYDDNGKLAAYAIVKKDDGLKLIYIDENLQPREVRGVEEDRFDDNPHLLVAGKDAYLYLRKLFTTGGMGYLYGVKDNEVYEPDISSHIDLFDKVGDHFVNNETYLERTEAGGVRKEREMTYDYDQKSRQFVIAEKKAHKNIESAIVPLNIEGKDAGTVDVIVKDGVTYYPFGEMNLLFVKYMPVTDTPRGELPGDYNDPATYYKDAGDGKTWFLVAWPGKGDEYFDAYYSEKNIFISIDELYEAPPGTREYFRPKNKPFVKDGIFYIDIEDLKTIFSIDYEKVKGTMVIKSGKYDPGRWERITTPGYDSPDEVVENEF